MTSKDNNLNESKTDGKYMFTEHNKISYERNHLIKNNMHHIFEMRFIRHASGLGWSQQQQVFFIELMSKIQYQKKGIINRDLQSGPGLFFVSETRFCI
jgi:uncharacterized membrane-anchored protein